MLPGTGFCTECGGELRPGAEVCPRCGARILCRTGPGRLTAALLAIFLGSLGAHKFYLGRIGPGVLYLLLCWTLLPGILGVIEGITYLLMTEEGFRARY
ncbi:TM2 domain-containing protein [bacterium]|nr:MAG: TM2 domain-containing protein [bacterium]